LQSLLLGSSPQLKSNGHVCILRLASAIHTVWITRCDYLIARSTRTAVRGWTAAADEVAWQ
jgi:hypothetical protein